METSTELRKVVHSTLLTQIRFGVYHCGERLPTIEEASARFRVSIDTARAAYLRLKDEGYITLTKNVGAAVKVNYSNQETERFIQMFFSARKNAMVDLGNAMRPLFGNAQWVGLKNASEETLQAMEGLLGESRASAPYAMLEHFNQKYKALGNTLLMRLVWQTFMFLHEPFFSVEENLRYFDGSAQYLPMILSLCRTKDWPALRVAVEGSIERLSPAISQFYKARITMLPPEKEVDFCWSSYQKSQQLCYSLAMELLISINRGLYPVGSLLPPQKELAAQRSVSVSTVRRAFALLGSVGAIKSAKYVGTQILPLEKATENSDLTKPVLRRRLLDMAESLQIFALSCKEVSQLTLSSFDANAVAELCSELKAYKRQQRGEVLSYFIMNLIGGCAPYQAIRTVYSELLRQFFWACALRGVMGGGEATNHMYHSYFDVLIPSLERRDFLRFSAAVEDLMIHELGRFMGALSQIGIPGAERILIPDGSSACSDTGVRPRYVT